ncbi:hypothetical protein [Streptomyces sp. NPDC058861]|uniref:hypothetical protein n=1 Tax=Streptomyces sp. NPDC058861 TaxID=3346653 RepID=UPI0036CB05F0
MAADPPSAGAAAEFIGRGWLADSVREWTASGSAYLFLTGGPGTGKSAAVEHLWGRAPAEGTAVHLCRAASRSSCDPVRFAESLAEQFSARLPGFTDALAQVARELSGRAGELRIEGTATAGTVHSHASLVGVRITLSHVTADEAFEQLVCRPLEILAPVNRPVAVVDALDEALTYRGRRTIAELVLGGTDRLPLRFVLTSRHDARITAAVDGLPDSFVVDLVDDAPDPVDDLFVYARHQLRGTPLAEPEREALARSLASEGAGNYLYVRHLAEELAAGTRETTGRDGGVVLPRGLDGVYRQFLRREIRPPGSAEAEERWRTAFRPVLALLVAAREEGFTAGRLAALLDRTEQEVLDVVRVLGQYLRGGPRGPWTLYHRSFAEFLLAGEDPYIDAAEGHRRIADHAFAEWEDAWDSCDDMYLLRHLPDHLMTAIETTTGGGPARPRSGARALQDRLYALATSPGYLSAQRATAPGRDSDLATLGLALEASLAAHAYDRAAGLALGLVRARGESDAVSPVRAATLWGAPTGAAKARTYPESVALVWLLLIVAELGIRSPGDVGAVLREVGSGGFTATDARWSPAIAGLLAPLMTRFTEEELAPVMDVADDVLLGHLAAFLLEDAGPEAALGPALRIREHIPRARTLTGILTHAALTALTGPGAHTDGPVVPSAADGDDDPARLGPMADRMADRLFPAQDDRAGWRSLLGPPEVADSILLVHAARGELETRLPELAARSGPGSDELSDDALLLARIVQAARRGPAGLASARAAGEAALAEHPGDVRILLHHTALAVRAGDPTATELVDTLLEASRAWSGSLADDPYAGHVDAFHGRCDLGLHLALVRVLAAAGQTDRAGQQAGLLREGDPAEYVRALAWTARAETRPDRRDALVAAARKAAGGIPRDLRAQAALLLADGDRERLKTAVARTVVRTRREPPAVGPARAALAWAAHVRGDHARARELGAEAVAWFVGLPQERRRPEHADRLVKNLLRARLPAEAAVVTRTPTTHYGSAILLHLGDVRHELVAHGEHTELTLLQEAEAEAEVAAGTGDPRARAGGPSSGTSLHGLSLATRVLRANGDRQAFEEASAALRTVVERILARLAEQPDYSWHNPDRDETAAAWCMLSAVRTQWPEALQTASARLAEARNRSVLRTASQDFFMGLYPRDAESREKTDLIMRRQVQTWAELAEAFHEVGDEGAAATALNNAYLQTRELDGSDLRAEAFTQLANTAVRLGWYAYLTSLWPEAARVRGASLGGVAESLVVAVLRGGPDATAARRALEGILGSPGLADLDYVDLLAALSVLSSGAEVEKHLLAAPSAPAH